LKKVTWIKEEEAAKMIGLSPETFRRYVKDPNRAMGINFTHTNNRNFEYCLEDIEAYKYRNSTLYKTKVA
jgi:hypothetical protein